MGRSGHFGICFPVVFLVVLGVTAASCFGQDEAEARSFGEIQLGAPVSTMPFPCNRPVVCEAPNESAWVRIWHGDGRIWRVDVVYTGRAPDIEEEIRSSPITLPQAIRSHSIRWGHKAPRLGFAGNEAGMRIVVDTANGIAYFADGVTTDSLVKEVRYLPAGDSLTAAASRSPLTGQGKWLVREAWLGPRYKNALADSETAPRGGIPGEELIRRDALAGELKKTSSEEKSLAAATLMLSARVSESLRKREEPDPAVAEQLKKAYSLLSATETEATVLINDHSDSLTPEDVLTLRLDVAGEADSRVRDLVREGFVE